MDKLTREELEAAWLAHRGPPQSATYGFRSVNTKHRRHCFDAGYKVAQTYIDALEQELAEATTRAERGGGASWQLARADEQLVWFWQMYHSCPCYARAESPSTHPHNLGCPTERAVLMAMGSRASGDIRGIRGAREERVVMTGITASAKPPYIIHETVRKTLPGQSHCGVRVVHAMPLERGIPCRTCERKAT